MSFIGLDWMSFIGLDGLSTVRIVSPILLTLACGCRDDSSNRVLPSRSEPAQDVDYNPPKPVAHNVAVPSAVADSSVVPVALPTIPSLRQSFPITFEGEFEADGAGSALVTVTFFKNDPRHGKVETNGFNGQATRSEDGKKWRYSLQGKTPQSPGANEIEVAVFAVKPTGNDSATLPDTPPNLVIARGRIDIAPK